MSMNYKKQESGPLNSVFLVKIKVGTEHSSILVKAPNVIENMAKMNANIDSINDKVYVEFFDVLNEDALDPQKQQSMSNLKLLS
jgi:hypothetical protein